MSRIYSITASNISAAAAMDLIAVYAGASMAFRVHSFTFSDTSGSATNLRFRLYKLPATVTTGSGGAAATLNKVTGTNDAAATATARAGDTTQATTSGTLVPLHADGWNTTNGYPWLFPTDDRPVVKPGEAVVLSIDTVSGTLALNATLVVEELF